MATEWRLAARMLALRTRRARRRAFATMAECLTPRFMGLAAVTLTLGAMTAQTHQRAVRAQEFGGPVWNQPASNLPRPLPASGMQSRLRRLPGVEEEIPVAASASEPLMTGPVTPRVPETAHYPTPAQQPSFAPPPDPAYAPFADSTQSTPGGMSDRGSPSWIVAAPAEGRLNAAQPNPAAANAGQPNTYAPSPRSGGAGGPPANGRSGAPVAPNAAGPAASQDLSAFEMPADFVPWWQEHVVQPLRESPQTIPVQINTLVVDTLRHSARVRALSDNAVIAETAITRAAAAFDSTTFMETKFVRGSNPTGNTLEAGFNVPRLREEDWFFRGGVRRRNEYGGKVELAQQIGIRDSNSQFFFPDNQGNARLVLSYNQPLLNGAGQCYNTSLVVLANLDTRVAFDKTAADLQDQLLTVIESHWDLYTQRARLMQRRGHVRRAEVVLAYLEKRAEVDALASQIASARAAVASRRTSIIRAEAEIRNAEARLRALVNSPELLNDRLAELIPIQTPSSAPLSVEPQSAFLTALENRSEIDAATQEIEAARVRLNVAKNELLPVLDLYLESYVAGLRDNYNIGRSLVDQFSVGEPGYSAGLKFEMPFERRAAKANQERRLAELRQLTSKFQATVETLHAEVDVAVREVETTHRELRSIYTQMLAAKTDMDYLQGRWERLPGDDRAASFLLEDLLASQERLSFAESAFVDAQVAYSLSLTRLNRSTGMLLKHEKVQLVRGHDGSASTLSFEPMDAARPSSSGNLPAPTRGPMAPQNAPGASPRIAPPANRVGPTAKQPTRPHISGANTANSSANSWASNPANHAASNPANQSGSPWNNRLANTPPVAPRGAMASPFAGTASGYAPTTGGHSPAPVGYVPPSATQNATQGASGYGGYTPNATPAGYSPPRYSPSNPQRQGAVGGPNNAYPASAYPTTSYRGPSAEPVATSSGEAASPFPSTAPAMTQTEAIPYTASQPAITTNNR